MTVPEVFYQRIPPKIKINARKMMLLGWLITWLLTTHAGIGNFTNTESTRAHSAQGSLKSPTPSLSPADFLSHQIFRLSHSPDSQPPSHVAPDTRYASSQSGWQASFLLEGITASSSVLGCIQRSNDQSQFHMFCLSYALSSLVRLDCDAFGEGTEVFALTHNSAAPRAPRGL